MLSSGSGGLAGGQKTGLLLENTAPPVIATNRPITNQLRCKKRTDCKLIDVLLFSRLERWQRSTSMSLQSVRFLHRNWKLIDVLLFSRLERWRLCLAPLAEH